MITRCADAAEDVAKFGIVVEELQQGFPACPVLAYTENVLCGRIEAHDEQVPVQQDHAGTHAVEDGSCQVAAIAVVAALARGALPG